MVSPESALKSLKEIKSVCTLHYLDKDLTERIFGVEAETPQSSGMPLDNRSLRESRKRSHHVFISSTEMIDNTPFRSVMMLGPNDEVIGHVVTPEEKEELEGKNGIFWLSKYFFFNPNKITGEVRNVLCPQEMKELESKIGIKNAICMFVSPNTDRYAREEFGITENIGGYTSVVSFDLE